MKKGISVKFLSIIFLYFHFQLSICFAGQPFITVIKSRDIAPYNLALKGFTKTFRETKVSVKLKVYNLEKGSIIKEVKSQKPDLILTVGTSATKVAIENIKDIPIVFSMVLDPEGSGLRAENITGASLDIPIETQFKYIKKVIPKVKRIGTIYNLKENEDLIRIAKQKAINFGFTLITFPIKFIEEIPKLDNMDIDLLWLIPDSLVCQPAIIKNILLSGLKRQIPVFGISPSYAKAGALMALSCDYEDIGSQTGEIALKILEGTKPADIPITLPTKIKLYLNLAVADRIGIKLRKEVINEASGIFGK